MRLKAWSLLAGLAMMMNGCHSAGRSTAAMHCSSHSVCSRNTAGRPLQNGARLPSSLRSDEILRCADPTLCEGNHVHISIPTDRIRARESGSVFLRSLPGRSGKVVTSLRPGEPVITHTRAATRRGKLWFLISTYFGDVGWVRENHLERIPGIEQGNTDLDAIQQELKRFNAAKTVRIGMWCVKDGRGDLVRSLKKVLDAHRLDLALLQCVPREKIGGLKRLAQEDTYGLVVTKARQGTEDLVMLYRRSTVQVRRSGAVELPGYFDILAARYEVVSKGEVYLLGNVGWHGGGPARKRELGRMVQYLKALKEKLGSAALVAGTWPTGRSGSWLSMERVLWVARKIKRLGIRIVPVPLACSSYRNGKPELRQYFLTWGSVAGLDRTRYSRVWGLCRLLECCPRSEAVVRCALQGSVSGKDCPIVLNLETGKHAASHP